MNQQTNGTTVRSLAETQPTSMWTSQTSGTMGGAQAGNLPDLCMDPRACVSVSDERRHQSDKGAQFKCVDGVNTHQSAPEREGFLQSESRPMRNTTNNGMDRQPLPVHNGVQIDNGVDCQPRAVRDMNMCSGFQIMNPIDWFTGPVDSRVEQSQPPSGVMCSVRVASNLDVQGVKEFLHTVLPLCVPEEGVGQDYEDDLVQQIVGRQVPDSECLFQVAAPHAGRHTTTTGLISSMCRDGKWFIKFAFVKETGVDERQVIQKLKSQLNGATSMHRLPNLSW